MPDRLPGQPTGEFLALEFRQALREHKAGLDWRALATIAGMVITIGGVIAAIAGQIYMTRSEAAAMEREHRTQEHAPISAAIQEGRSFRAAQVEINRALVGGITDIKEQTNRIERNQQRNGGRPR